MKRYIQVRLPEDLLPLLSTWRRRKQEHFLVVTLTTAHEVIRVHLVTKGLINKTLVHPRECFFPAIKDYAASVMFVHNHPSGNCQPSSEDISVCQRLEQAGKILGIHVLDNIIVTRDELFSFRRGNMCSPFDVSEDMLTGQAIL